MAIATKEMIDIENPAVQEAFESEVIMVEEPIPQIVEQSIDQPVVAVATLAQRVSSEKTRTLNDVANDLLDNMDKALRARRSLRWGDVSTQLSEAYGLFLDQPVPVASAYAQPTTRSVEAKGILRDAVVLSQEMIARQDFDATRMNRLNSILGSFARAMYTY